MPIMPMNRHLAPIVCWLAAGCAVALAGDADGAKRSFVSMRTVVEITIPTGSGSDLDPEDLADEAERVIRRANDLWSPKGEASDVRRLNEAKPGEWVAVDPATIRIVREALRWHRLTGGAFEPTIAPLKRLYRFDGGVLVRWPSEEEIAEARGRVGADRLVVDEPGFHLAWTEPGMALDLGGVAKGFAADLAAEVLRAHGVENALINVGGEIRALGAKPGAPPSPWRVGVADPRGEGIIAVREAASIAMATSGNYESYFEYEGRRYSHIIDPATGLPLPEKVVGVTVIHPRSAAAADALATALSVLGSARGGEFLAGSWREADLEGAEVVMYEKTDGGGLVATRFAVGTDGFVKVEEEGR